MGNTLYKDIGNSTVVETLFQYDVLYDNIYIVFLQRHSHISSYVRHIETIPR